MQIAERKKISEFFFASSFFCPLNSFDDKNEHSMKSSACRLPPRTTTARRLNRLQIRIRQRREEQSSDLSSVGQ